MSEGYNFAAIGLSDKPFPVGTRWRTRAGAEVEVVQVWSDRRWPFVVTKITRCTDGSVPEGLHKISLCPDGRYFLDGGMNHACDLVECLS